MTLFIDLPDFCRSLLGVLVFEFWADDGIRLAWPTGVKLAWGAGRLPGVMSAGKSYGLAASICFWETDLLRWFAFRWEMPEVETD